MERRHLTLRGNNINLTLAALTEERTCLTSQPSPDVAVMFFENYFFRTNSNLMAVVIAAMKDETTCDIEIMAGGGGQGLFGIDWGSENAMIDALNESLERLAGQYGQTIEDIRS